MANELRYRATIKDDVSGPLERLKDKFGQLRAAGAKPLFQGLAMGAGIAAFDALRSGVASATSAVADFIAGSISAASDQREAMALTDQVFESSTESVKAWARNSKDAFSATEALDFASRFGTAFKNVGMALDETTAKAKEMTTLAGDLGSAFNTSSEEAATALRSGLLGESEPLRRFGVFLDEAKVKAKAAAMGMEALGGKLSDGQKVAARYALIMEQTADSQGMFGRDTGSLADAQKRLETNMADLSAEIGTDLLPGLVSLTDWANEEGIPALRGLLDVAGEVGDAIALLADNVAALRVSDNSQFKDLADQLSGVHRETSMTTDSLVDFRDAERASTYAAGRLDSAADSAAGSVEDVGDAAKEAADHFADLKKNAKAALGVLLDPSPKELKLGLEKARIEGRELERKLKDLEGVKHPTKDTRKDIIDTKLAIIDNQQEIVNLSDQLTALDKTRLDKHEALVRRLATDWGAPIGAIDAYLNRLDDVNNAGNGSRTRSGSWGTSSGHHNSRNGQRRERGGLVMPGQSYRVGEKSEEGLVMFPGGGGMVIPGGGGSQASGGSGGSLTINVSTPLLTPGAAQALADAIAPSVTRWQQRRGL